MTEASSTTNAERSVSALRAQLTIVIPSYRCAAYLPAAVASALSTPVARILIADDGSDADTLAVAEGMFGSNPRVRVLASRLNRGVAANLNAAVDHVRTPFFAKLDGDDVLIPEFLEAAFPIIASKPNLAVLAGHELRIAADDVLEFRPELLPKGHGAAVTRIMEGAEAYRFILEWNPNPTSSGAIYRTDAFRAVGGFDPGIQWGEDWEIWVRFAKSWQVGYTGAPSALYRIHNQSATAATVRQNRICYGYSAVYRRAAELCEYPEVFPVIRRKLFYLSRLFVTAGVRHLRISSRESLEYWRHAALALIIAATAVGGDAASLGGGSSTRPPVVEPLPTRLDG
jgi:glycosyltransferase involved in cell wall biosynthesis